MFKPAVKEEAKLRLAIAGPSGSGKTFTALAVGTALGRVALVDTEHGSASKYADIFQFDVLNLDPPFHPARFVEAIRAAEQGGYDVVVLDSISHAWNGTGGVLEIVEQAAKRFKGNSYVGWQEGTPAHNLLIEGIVGAGIHVIATMRSKQEYILVEKGGKQVPQKVGMAPIQRDSMEYEFDVYLEMTMDNDAIVQKTRCPLLTGAVLPKPGADLAGVLQEWLSGAAPPSDEELAQQALEAATPEAFARAAYRMSGARMAFDNETAIVKWLDWVGASVNGNNALVLAAVRSYVNAVADGANKRDAAEAAKIVLTADPREAEIAAEATTAAALLFPDEEE